MELGIGLSEKRPVRVPKGRFVSAVSGLKLRRRSGRSHGKYRGRHDSNQNKVGHMTVLPHAIDTATNFHEKNIEKRKP